ncbi:MAG: alkaline phosphatase [Candidatus Saccharibacteria bacterium]|nr:alkaline phosphatase [Candidatus Saccharibacteria bacterium]
MGRLTAHLRRAWRSRRFRQALFTWLAPALLSLVVLFGAHLRVQADTPPSTSELQQYLQNNQLGVYQGIGNDYPQIFYYYKDQSIAITNDEFPHLHPLASGQYVTWQGVVSGQAQVFLYDILNNTTLQLSLASPNEGIAMSGNHVVWQSWDGDYWQVYYYDGVQAQQITRDPNNSVRAVTDQRRIIYTEQLGPDDWKVQSYDVASGQQTTIRQGSTPTAAYPRIHEDGSVTTDFANY